jgi:hypothetical protein
MGRNGFEYIVGVVPGVHRCNRRVRWRQGSDGAALPTDLISDIQGWLKIRPAASLILSCESLGLVASATNPWRVSDNNAGVSTLYNGQGVKQ